MLISLRMRRISVEIVLSQFNFFFRILIFE